ncbi:MAG: hypothetical protein D6760_00485, partial [Deltaproteobacteria bacterium]
MVVGLGGRFWAARTLVACCVASILIAPAQPAHASIRRSAFDTLYTDPALATLRADLGALGYSADTLFAVLQGYEGFMAAYPDSAGAFDQDGLRSNLDAVFAGTTVTTPMHRDILARMANMFWVELRIGPPWHLRDLSPEGLRDLYFPVMNDPIWRGDYDTVFNVLTPTLSFRGETPPIEDTLSIAAPGHFLLFPLAWKIAAGATSSRSALEALVRWMEDRFFHPYLNSSKGEDWDQTVYEKYPLVYQDFYYPGYPGWYDFFNVFLERTADCHLAARILKALAAAINIPALSGEVDYPPEPHGGHGATFFRDLGVFVHGDWIADLVAIPPDRLLLDQTAFAQVLADGHLPGKLNDDYLHLEAKLRQELNNMLGLRRTANATTLYVEGT